MTKRSIRSKVSQFCNAWHTWSGRSKPAKDRLSTHAADWKKILICAWSTPMDQEHGTSSFVINLGRRIGWMQSITGVRAGQGVGSLIGTCGSSGVWFLKFTTCTCGPTELLCKMTALWWPWLYNQRMWSNSTRLLVLTSWYVKWYGRSPSFT